MAMLNNQMVICCNPGMEKDSPHCLDFCIGFDSLWLLLSQRTSIFLVETCWNLSNSQQFGLKVLLPVSPCPTWSGPQLLQQKQPLDHHPPSPAQGRGGAVGTDWKLCEAAGTVRGRNCLAAKHLPERLRNSEQLMFSLTWNDCGILWPRHSDEFAEDFMAELWPFNMI